MAAEPGTAPVAPPSGAGGGGGAQVLQQIEGLLVQLLQSEPEPEIQQAVQNIQKQVEALQPIIGKDQAQEMQSGLANPAGPEGGGEGGGPPGGSQPEPGGAAPGGGGGGEPTHEVEIHIRPAPRDFAGAKKAAMATHAERGHFSQQSPPGQTPTTEKQRQKARG